MHGSKNESIEFSYFSERGTVFKKTHPFEGIINNFKRRYEDTDSNTVRDELSKYLSLQSCPSCNGTRLRLEARNVLISKHNLHEICEFPLRKAHEFFNTSHSLALKQRLPVKLFKKLKI